LNLNEIEEDRKRNRKQRLEFITMYAQWVKRTPNSVWSKQQKQMLDEVIKSANRIEKEGVTVN
jgi:hypothetical protein